MSEAPESDAKASGVAAVERAIAILNAFRTGDGSLSLNEIARRTKRVIGQNLRYSLVYNLLALPLAAAGMIPPWLAAIGMTASSLVVIFNALRLMD